MQWIAKLIYFFFVLPVYLSFAISLVGIIIVGIYQLCITVFARRYNR